MEKAACVCSNHGTAHIRAAESSDVASCNVPASSAFTRTLSNFTHADSSKHVLSSVGGALFGSVFASSAFMTNARQPSMSQRGFNRVTSCISLLSGRSRTSIANKVTYSAHCAIVCVPLSDSRNPRVITLGRTKRLLASDCVSLFRT